MLSYITLFDVATSYIERHHTFFGLGNTRCPIARHRTVSARPRTLLVYEGNESHVIKNMAATVKFSSPLYGVALRDTVHLYHVTSYFLLYPLLYGVALSDSVKQFHMTLISFINQ